MNDVVYFNFMNVLLSQCSDSAMLNYSLPLVGITLAEQIRDRGYEIIICIDDLSKHAKSYRQISLILNKVPSRDAFPADIFNIHSSILERCGRLNLYFKGSISSLPIIETINSDITEYIATNVISITDRQIYTNRDLFNFGIRPSIDSSLSVSRIGSNAQCKFMKILSKGIKNELTNLRQSSSFTAFSSLLDIIFYQDHLFIFSLESTIIFLIFFHYIFKSTIFTYYSTTELLNSYFQTTIVEYYLFSFINLKIIFFIVATHLFLLFYLAFISKSNFNHKIHGLISSMFFFFSF